MRLLQDFARARAGGVAIMFGLSLVVLGMFVGLAIDGARIYNATRKVEVALDAAALAGAKLLNETGPDANVQSAAYAEFQANSANLGIGGAALTGFTAVPDVANSIVNVAVNLAVPTTFAKLAGLGEMRVAKAASASYSMAKIEVALAVDVTGSMNDTPPGDTLTKLGALKAAASSLIDTLFVGAVTDSSVRISVVPWSSGVKAGGYRTPVAGSSSGSDCLVERAGDGATSDIVPGPLTYALPMPPTSLAMGYACPDLAVIPLSGRLEAASLKSRINSMNGIGGTAGHLGAAWAWYMLSHNWASYHPPGSQPEAPSPKVIKAAVIMTDGIFNTSHFGGTLDSGTGGYNEQSYTTFKSLCDGMIAQGIRVYTIAFDLTDTHAVEKLAECSGANALTVANAAELHAAFQSIASELNSIRLTR